MPKQTVIVAIVHELLKRRTFANIGELADAVKWACARVHVPYDAGRISDAIRIVQYTRPILWRTRPILRPAASAPPPISHAEATRILADLGLEA